MSPRRLTVQLVQVNYRYGNNVFLPYSIGCLQAAVENSRELSRVIEFRTPVFERIPIDDVLERIGTVDVLGLSAYIWNWEYVKLLGSKFRSINSKALIIVGGPQVPARDPNIFRNELAFADAVVRGEGESTFLEILRTYCEGESLLQVKGLLLPDTTNSSRNVVSTGDVNRIENLNVFPSPYSSGVFDRLVKTNDTLSFQASQETHRGCPYACTFCDWGSATMSRVRRFSRDRITAEYEWFGVNGIELVYNCDANYGLFKEDVDLTRELVQTNKKYGFPKKFRAAYAKNSSQRVFDIAKILNESEMCKGVTLSLQSTDENVLTLIKRKNMQVNKFAELVSLYQQNRIPTYTELIIGLPGETIESFTNGLNEMLEAGQHDSLNIYHAMVLPNAELNDPSYRQLHGIQSVKTPLLLLHGTDSDNIAEFNEIVIQTKTMSVQDWIGLTTLAYVIQAFHCLNVTKKIAIALNRLCGVPYTDFYASMISWVLNTMKGPGSDIARIQEMCAEVCQGHGSFDFKERRFGNIVWPTEEALFLSTSLSDNREWLRDFLTSNYGDRVQIRNLIELVEYQHLSTVYPRIGSSVDNAIVEFCSDWNAITGWEKPESVMSGYLGKHVRMRLNAKSGQWKCLEDYARDVVWYGRKGTAIENKIETL